MAISTSKTPVKTRTKILDVSAALFSRHGYNGTALRDIAKALDMKAGSLYYHFDSKEQIVLEVLKIGIKNIIHTVIAEVEGLPKDSTSREVMVAAAKGHLRALHEKGDYTSTSILNYGQLPDSVQEAGRVTREQYEDMWRKWLTNAQDKGDIRADVNLTILRVSILGALNRLLTWYKKGELSINDIATIQIGIFWDGIDT
ncbi:MAG TPA: TetR/AcrR family transcriptional regulator [Cycloclasticus sp.]|jgi:AcrR family transcriptional regulator|nr:TetR/AcrR family transcriptional regulator [Cycloclasticus sp.]HIL91186.1 TetR/AcrR family transcriptional regulator [Cycloclasticus sp.]